MLKFSKFLVTLADVLHKPILPIMLEPTPWPPPGPMALILSSLVYIDLCGVGGHGGIGKKGDNESRFKEILDRITRYIAGFVDLPLFNRNYMLPDLFQAQQSQNTDAILIMANNQHLNQTSGLSGLQEIHRDGVELRLVNNTNSLSTDQQQSSDHSNENQNDSIDGADLMSLSGDSTQQATNSTEHTGQLLSANGLESLINSSILTGDLRRMSNGRASNSHLQAISILESSNDHQDNSQETARVINFFFTFLQI